MDDYTGNKAACSSDTGGNIKIWHLNQGVLHLQKSAQLLWCGDNAWNTKRPTRRVQLNKANLSGNFPGYKEMLLFLVLFQNNVLANCAHFMEFAWNKFYPLGLGTSDNPLQLKLSVFYFKSQNHNFTRVICSDFTSCQKC